MARSTCLYLTVFAGINGQEYVFVSDCVCRHQWPGVHVPAEGT